MAGNGPSASSGQPQQMPMPAQYHGKAPVEAPDNADDLALRIADVAMLCRHMARYSDEFAARLEAMAAQYARDMQRFMGKIAGK